MDVNARELIAKYIEPDPYRPGLADARISGYRFHVWALIGYLKAVLGDAASYELVGGEYRGPLGPVQEVAQEYDVPLDAVLAALAYYAEHPQVIDARIAANVVSAA